MPIGFGKYVNYANKNVDLNDDELKKNQIFNSK